MTLLRQKKVSCNTKAFSYFFIGGRLIFGEGLLPLLLLLLLLLLYYYYYY